MSVIPSESGHDDGDFGQLRPILLMTDNDALAAAAMLALDQLTWPVRRARNLEEAAVLGSTCSWELILCDVRLASGHQVPTAVRGNRNVDTPVLTMARLEDLPRTPGAEPLAARVLRPEEGSPYALAELLASELECTIEGRVLASARALVSANTRNAVVVPAALAAAHRLDWMYTHAPSLEQAAAVVTQQENLAKQVLRLAHALAGDVAARAWTLDRVLLDLGLQRFIPLVKIIAARMMFPVRDPERARSLHTIWRFSVARALAMRALASRAHPGVPADVDWYHAFDAGLFADAGASLLIWLQDQSQPRRSRHPFLNTLPARLAACHEWLGERLVERWKHPRPIGVVAGGHHGTASADPGGMRTMAFAACAVVADAGVGADPTGAADHTEAGQALARLDVDAFTRGHVAALVRVELASIEEALS
jgi:hypothetical protein